MTEITNAQIFDKLISIEGTLNLLFRGRQHSSLNDLEDAVKANGRMDVRQVELFLGGKSRTWAINRMRKLGGKSYFKLIIGDKRLARPTIIYYSEEEEQRTNINKIKELLEKVHEASFATITAHLEKNVVTHFEYVKSLIDGIISKEEGKYFIKDGNKLCKTI